MSIIPQSSGFKTIKIQLIKKCLAMLLSQLSRKIILHFSPTKITAPAHWLCENQPLFTKNNKQPPAGIIAMKFYFQAYKVLKDRYIQN